MNHHSHLSILFLRRRKMESNEILYSIKGPKTLLEMTWEEVEQALQKTDICLIAIGSIEEHGCHLPLGTDTFQSTESVKTVQRLLDAEGITIVVGPTIEFGINPGAMSYPGSITVRPDTLKALLVDVCESLYQHGFRKIALFLGHDENMHVMAVAAQELVRAHNDLKVITLNPMPALKESEGQSLKPKKPDGHGGAGETSRSLVIHPNLVHLDRARVKDGVDRPFQRSIPGSLGPLFGGGVFNPAMDLHVYDRHEDHPGQTGDPNQADPEIGHKAYLAMAQWVADVIKRDFLGQ
jgi:creatinine amidohydrolase